MEKKPDMTTLEQLYVDGLFTIDEIKKMRDKFNISCANCDCDDIRFLMQDDDDGYCETCTNPYATFVMKCVECGQAIGFRT